MSGRTGRAAAAVAPAPRRWVVLAASVLIVMCTGSIYSFSVFAGPLGEAHGWTQAQVMVAFAVNGALAPVPMVLGGIALDRGWARWLMLVGAVLFGGGFALTGTATSLVALVVLYGVVTAFGVGFCYSTAVSNTVKLFPDRRGLAAGLITVGVGLSSVIAAPVARALIASVGVSAAFLRMGLVYGVVAFAAAWFVRPAPSAPAGVAVDGLPWHRMVRTPRFAVLFGLFAACLFAPVMALSQLSGIGQSSSYGLSAAGAALFVAAFAMCKALGGPTWGALVDRKGGAVVVAALATVSAASLAVLLTVHSPVGFAIGVAGLGSTFGGVTGVFPALTMAAFGPRHQGTNYAIMFVAYAAAAFVGPRLAATLGAGGSYDGALAIALAVTLAGAGSSVFLREPRRSRPPVRAAAPEPEPEPVPVPVPEKDEIPA